MSLGAIFEGDSPSEHYRNNEYSVAELTDKVRSLEEQLEIHVNPPKPEQSMTQTDKLGVSAVFTMVGGILISAVATLWPSDTSTWVIIGIAVITFILCGLTYSNRL